MDVKHKYSHIVERMKAGEATRMKLAETDECVFQDQFDEQDSMPMRPSLIEVQHQRMCKFRCYSHI